MQNAYILMALISALLSLIAVLYILQRRSAVGASSLALVMLSTAIWSFGYAMELAGPDLKIMRFWLRFEYLGIAFLPLWGVRFSFQYIGRTDWQGIRNTAALAVIPLITLILNWTNEWHGLFYSGISIDTSSGIAVLALKKGTWYWINVANMYGSYMLMSFLLMQNFWNKRDLYRAQAFILIIALLPPVVANAIYLTPLNPLPNLDLSPFAFTITGIVIICGLYHFRLFDVVPVARDRLIESMKDGVIVLDNTNCVVDINPAAKRLIRAKSSSQIGQSVDALLPGWAEFLDYDQDIEKRLEKTIVTDNGIQHLDISVIRLVDGQENTSGKLVLLRDINAQKEMAEEREKLVCSLQDALARVKTLNGLLPICARCKKIRDDSGYWHQIETYIQKHSEADFSHSICPECARELYPDYYRGGKTETDPE